MPPDLSAKRKNRTLTACICLCACALLSQTASAQLVPGLRLDFKQRTLEFRIQAKDLQLAYRVTPSGGIQMLPAPKTAVVVDEAVKIHVEEGPEGNGRLRLDRGDSSYQLLLRPDNGLAGTTMVTGLPFGYRFLPKEGQANSGQSWTQEFPAPDASAGLRVRTAYRYTLIGGKKVPGCELCAMIQVEGTRNFLPGPSLDRAVENIPEVKSTEFYTEDRTFAVGMVLFDRKERFIHRFELNANTSLLTLLPIPGLMRQVILEYPEVPLEQ